MRPMNAGVARAYFLALYYLSWAWFALGALAISGVCLPLLLFPARERLGPATRQTIRRFLRLWGWWLNTCGVVRQEWRGFERPLTVGTVYVANHPTLVDATFLLSRLPDAICVMKPSLMRNPAIAPATTLAGYVASGMTLDGIHDAAAKVAAGRSLLVFPEGRRTPEGSVLGPMMHGFLLSAQRAHAPVELIMIQATPGLTTKGRSWWRPPPVLPARVTLTLDRRWEWQAGRASAELLAEIELRLKTLLH